MKRVIRGAAASVAMAVAVAVAVVSGTQATAAAKAAPPGNGLSAYVVLTNRGPLPACPPDPGACTSANLVWE
jgi:hypothetical protein